MEETPEKYRNHSNDFNEEVVLHYGTEVVEN
jgi:hypothetical protein